MRDKKIESGLTKELLSLGKLVDLAKNKPDQEERAVKLFPNSVEQELENLLCRRLTDEVLSIHIVQQTGTKNVGIGSLRSA